MMRRALEVRERRSFGVMVEAIEEKHDDNTEEEFSSS